MTPRHATPPLTEDDLHDALLPFGRSRMLPRAAYTSDEVFAWELEHLHAGLWTCVGWAARMAGPGSLRAVQICSPGTPATRGGPSSAPTTPGTTRSTARSGWRPGSATCPGSTRPSGGSCRC